MHLRETLIKGERFLNATSMRSPFVNLQPLSLCHRKIPLLVLCPRPWQFAVETVR